MAAVTLGAFAQVMTVEFRDFRDLPSDRLVRPPLGCGTPSDHLRIGEAWPR